MNKCIKCGSHAFNLKRDGIDQGGFCDVHYWQGMASRTKELADSEGSRAVEYLRRARKAETENKRLTAERDALVSACQRARSCITGLLRRTPVRDVAETLAEIDAAIAKEKT